MRHGPCEQPRPIVRRLLKKIADETSQLISSVNWFQLLIAIVLILLFALARLYWPQLDG